MRKDFVFNVCAGKDKSEKTLFEKKARENDWVEGNHPFVRAIRSSHLLDLKLILNKLLNI